MFNLVLWKLLCSGDNGDESDVFLMGERNIKVTHFSARQNEISSVVELEL